MATVECAASVSWIGPADSAKRFTVQESGSHSTEAIRAGQRADGSL